MPRESFKDNSLGPFTSKKLLATVPRKTSSKLYFQATSSDLIWHAPISVAERGEGFQPIHDIGNVDTKYYRVKLSSALLPNLESKQYTRDFRGAAPLDLAENFGLAEVFKKGPKGSRYRPNEAPSVSETDYSRFFHDYTPKETFEAKGALCKPGMEDTRTRTMGGTNGGTPASQYGDVHSVRGTAWSKGNPFIPKSQIHVHKTFDGWRTSNQDEFQEGFKPRPSRRLLRGKAEKVNELLAGMRASTMAHLKRCSTAPESVARPRTTHL